MASSIKTVLITGITGYLGSRLAKEFINAGYRVVGLKRTISLLEKLKGICDDIELFSIDDGGITAVFKDNSIDFVIHAATCYGRSGESSLSVSRANTDFPHELLIEAINHDVKVFINTGTTLDRFVNAYSLSKYHFVDWAKLLVQSADIRFVDFRLEHFYGPGDSDTKFVTAMIKRCLVNDDKIPLTRGEQERDFIYIDDVISAYMTVISSLDKLTSSYHEFDVGSGIIIGG